jgi:hypothetical protein
MFSVFYKSLKSPANIYSIDKFKVDGDKVCWLVVTMKELYLLRGTSNQNGEDKVTCTLLNDPNRRSGKTWLSKEYLDLDNVSCKTFNLKSKPYKKQKSSN